MYPYILCICIRIVYLYFKKKNIIIPESQSNLAQAGGGEEINWCGGQWKYPHSCSPEGANCEYFAKWEFVEETDEIQFTVSSKHSNLWTGIGFSDDFSMVSTPY